jgi:hypothetical protein
MFFGFFVDVYYARVESKKGKMSIKFPNRMSNRCRGQNMKHKIAPTKAEDKIIIQVANKHTESLRYTN